MADKKSPPPPRRPTPPPSRPSPGDFQKDHRGGQKGENTVSFDRPPPSKPKK